MPRKAKITDDELVRRLVTIKVMIAGMKDALPKTAKELRRESCESLNELIEDIRR